MLYILLLSAVLLLVEASSSMEFMIKHKESGKYIHPRNSDVAIPNDDDLLIHSTYHHNMHMAFDQIDKEWGYIRHVSSGKFFHPKGGSESPGDNTKVVLHSDKRPWAKFALDQVNNRLVHYHGKFIHPTGGGGFPDDNTPVVLHQDVHHNMEFKLVNTNTSNPEEEVFPYGDAKIVGKWVLVKSFENPLATHTYSYKVKVGKSETESSKSSFKFVWESGISAQFYFAKMSTSASLSAEIQRSSSETWETEIEKIDIVKVEIGHPVAVWQKHYIGDQFGHTALHQSNMIADTNSPDITPDDYAYTRYRFI